MLNQRRWRRSRRGWIYFARSRVALAILSVSVFVLAETTALVWPSSGVAQLSIARIVFEQGEAMYPITETNRPEDVAGPKEIIAGFVYQRFEGEAINEDEHLFSVLTRQLVRAARILRKQF